MTLKNVMPLYSTEQPSFHLIEKFKYWNMRYMGPESLPNLTLQTHPFYADEETYESSGNSPLCWSKWAT